jgi:hypothetical protein
MSREQDLAVTIVRHVDDHQPGWVTCTLLDAHAREWSFIEKVPVVTLEDLDAHSQYPRPGVIRCWIVECTMDADGRELVLVDTDSPWRVEATSGETRFVVRSDQLTEIDEDPE